MKCSFCGDHNVRSCPTKQAVLSSCLSFEDNLLASIFLNRYTLMIMNCVSYLLFALIVLSFKNLDFLALILINYFGTIFLVPMHSNITVLLKPISSLK